MEPLLGRSLRFGVSAGTDTYDVTECRPCRSMCPYGEYLNDICDGYHHYDPVGCTPCTQDCPFGLKMFGECPGDTTANAVACVPDNVDCGIDMYLYLEVTFEDGVATTVYDCVDCILDCGPGKFIRFARRCMRADLPTRLAR